MYSWMVLGGLIVFILCLFVIYKDNKEGFLTQDPDSLRAQRQQLQFEQEQRSNDLARIIHPMTTLSPDSVSQSVVQQIPTSTSKTVSKTTLVSQNLGYGGTDDTSGKSGPGVENTGLVQSKINFCESLPLNCDFSDPRTAECGMCLTGGVSSTGQPLRGGMYISSEDQIRANQVAAVNGGPAKYKPTVGTCSPANFVVEKETCSARLDQALCAATTALSNDNKCGQCYGSAGPLIYVGTKPRKFNAYLNVSHPGVYAPMVVRYGSNTARIESSQQYILDPKQLAITITEGDVITIEINGFPKAWCAWLSSIDGKRTIGINIGQQSISPANSIGVIGDKRSSSINKAFSKQSGFSAFSRTVPNTVMWYGRRETMNGIPISAKYGDSDVLKQILSLGANQNVRVPDDLGVSVAAEQATLVVKMDDGRNHFIPYGGSLGRTLLENSVGITFQCPVTLDDPYYKMDVQDCPTGPMIFTPAGAGIMGSNSCFKADGSFNPGLFCLQELFTGAGGTEKGTLYPVDQNSANKIVQTVGSGKPDLDATASYLNDLGIKAIYGTDSAGKPISIGEYQDASMKMLGLNPKNICDGRNKETGPHSPVCLDYLWRTSGKPGSNGSNYNFCGARGKLAPLNIDGTPNEENIATVNAMGSVSNVQEYYKSLYDAAQDTSDFYNWSDAMANCYNSTVTEPAFDSKTCQKPTVGGINIISATYGRNCGTPFGNRTSVLQTMANGKDSFVYTWDPKATGGDPAGGCGKNLDITYNCGGGPTKTLHIQRPEGEDIDITCTPTQTPSVKGVNILDATYGKNCPRSNAGNRTRYFKSRANGLPVYDYNFKHGESGGDPHPGCPKNLEINYNCNGGFTQNIKFDGEASGNAAIFLDCDPPKLVGWFDASDINGDGSTLPDKTQITTWKDKSGEGNHAVRGSWGNAPIVINNGKNNKAVLDVNGGTQMNFNLGTSTKKYSIFTVQYGKGQGWSRLLNGRGRKGVDGYLYYGLGSSSGLFYTMIGDGEWQWSGTNSPTVDLAGKWSQTDLITKGNSTFTTANGVVQSPTKWNPIGEISGITIGCHGNGGQQWNGLIAEIQVYAGTVDPDMAQSIRDELRKKWGL